MKKRKIQWLKKPIPMNIRHYSKYGNILIDGAECIEKSNMKETLVLDSPRENFHLHMGFRKSVITNESEKNAEWKHIPLTKKSFDKMLKGGEKEDGRRTRKILLRGDNQSFG
ncbi:MAG: hypothetical protein KJ905_02830 [Nanoarchaeota archaeon]|nr:hypothetical protein [Nanoarchaeota archaeon]MBU1501684.1 hypothetical protein [Nanoarchaeota archaeon]